jgi:para-aminobenzoate synthetase component 1
MEKTRFLSISFPSCNNEIIAISHEDELSDFSELDEIDKFISKHKGNYLFMCLPFELKNEMEELQSSNKDLINFPKILIWKAELVMEIIDGNINILEGQMNKQFQELIDKYVNGKKTSEIPTIKFESQISKKDYLKNVQLLKNEIQFGNIYEINYCQQYFASNLNHIPSFEIFEKLKDLTKAPFSAYLNTEKFEVFCGSPERYLQKNGKKLISKPIKGTSKRGNDFQEDEFLKTKLNSDIKERAENIMITDLVRNDLSKIASKNSVNVDELCGIYSFGTVHQMISTISCELKQNTTFSEILKATFPMGSMTGAPKIAALKLIEKHEEFKRGLYSGSIGYMRPNGDFDLNVVIRSLIYNKADKILSASVGGAITINSDEENEYEECQVKIKKIIDIFDGRRN